ncbi:MAG: DUF4387 domain-containing protein [Desulfotomaculaceae bacterium]|nr:DUF4387 domain-containing protein [Desulfotomaculaceae bacterium]
MRKIKITEMAEVIRSKNSGPYELTFDIIFKDRENFELARRSGVFTKKLFAALYSIEADQVIGVIEFAQANAIKATIVRPVVSGGVGDSDIYGAQQHAPLLNIEVPVK